MVLGLFVYETSRSIHVHARRLLRRLRLIRHLCSVLRINTSLKCFSFAEIVSRVSRTILYRSLVCFGTEAATDASMLFGGHFYVPRCGLRGPVGAGVPHYT